MHYILVDSANIFFKSRHIASRSQDDWQKIGMALHLTLSGVQSVIRKTGGDLPIHVVFCLEGRSWRKDFYEPYKRNRLVKQAALTESEAKLDQMFWETYEKLITFLREKTNVSVIRSPIAEGDDIIARWIHLHPEDNHTIISSDGDFAQLINTKVSQYNSLSNNLITIDGYFDDRGRQVKDKKTGEPKKLGEPEYLLFEKCMRGDTSDNVFSAYPGVRTKSTKKNVGLIEAYADRHRKGFNWNNLMLQQWLDHEGNQHRVLDDYQRNVTLCDLTAQPPEIQKAIDESISSEIKSETVSNVGIHFLKFCSKWELTTISNHADSYARWLNAPYKGELGVKLI